MLALVSRDPAGSGTRTLGVRFQVGKVRELEISSYFPHQEPVAPIGFVDLGPSVLGGDASLGFGLGGGGMVCLLLLVTRAFLCCLSLYFFGRTCAPVSALLGGPQE